MDEALASKISELSTPKRRVLLRRLLQQGHGVDQLPISRGGAPSETPVLSTQVPLLILEAIRAGSLYNRISLALHLKGDLNAECLVAAFADVTARHEALRTLFPHRDGGWLATVLDSFVPTLEILELGAAAPSDVALAIARHRPAIEDTSFNLSEAPPWRGCLLRLSDTEHGLLVCFHHVIADGWAIELLTHDLSSAYKARLGGAAPRWHGPPLQPRDYARFEEDLAALRVHERAPDEARCRDGAAELAEPTTSPADYLRPDTPTDLAGIAHRTIDSQTMQSVSQICEHIPATRAAALLAGALVALRDFTGDLKLSVAVAVAQRDNPDTHDLFAPLLTVQRLDFDVDDEERVADLIARANRELLRLAHRSAPSYASSGDGAPAARCLLIVQNANRGPPDFPGIQTSVIPATRAGALYDLTIVFHVMGTTCSVAVEYAADLFDPRTAQQIADHIAGTLSSISLGADRAIRETSRPTIAEALEFLSSDEPEPTAGPLIRPIDAFLTQVLRDPATIAVQTEHRQVRSDELARDAAALASSLREPGNKTRPVGLLTNDGLTAVTGMLACHMAGRAFAMLDPDLAPERIVEMAKFARIADVVYDGAHTEIGQRLSAELVCGADAWPNNAASSPVTAFDPRSHTPVAADRSPAYIAFTSGSTGRPKAIIQSQIAFSQFLTWQQGAFALTPHDRVAMWSSLAFDACYTELFGALSCGATLCIPDANLRRDPAYVVKWLEQAGITYLLTIPSFLSLIMAELEAAPRLLPRLRDVAVSGEILSPDLCRRFHAAAPSVRLHNLFGPTEAVLASRHIVRPDRPERLRVPVGRPLAGRRLLLTDEAGRPVARGAVGEIGIVSRYLTEGYLREDGTAAPFPNFPHGGEGERFYRSGDFGRIGFDGALHFLGRRDGQIKISGVRITLEEIEAFLLRHSRAKHCTVVDRASEGGDRLLIAFLVGDDAAAFPDHAFMLAPRVEALALRSAVAASLGRVAAPAYFVRAQSLPRTPTGKIDRLALRAVYPNALPASPDDLISAEDTSPAAARIRAAWRSVISAPFSDEDGFFDIGGNSLLAVRLVDALNKACPGVFRLLDIYANPSVAAMCELSRRRETVADDALSEGLQRARQRRRARQAGVAPRASNSEDA